MKLRCRGRPIGSRGSSVPLNPDQIKTVFRMARQERHPDPAEVMLALSIELGLRATELASLTWDDVFGQNGQIRDCVSIRAAFSGKPMYFDLTNLPKLRSKLADYYEKRRFTSGEEVSEPLFRSQRSAALTPASIARYLTQLYRKAGASGGSSRSGRRTRDVLRTATTKPPLMP
jgi:integrase